MATRFAVLFARALLPLVLTVPVGSCERRPVASVEPATSPPKALPTERTPLKLPSWLPPDYPKLSDTPAAWKTLGEVIDGRPWTPGARHLVVSRLGDQTFTVTAMDFANLTSWASFPATVVLRLGASGDAAYILATTIDTPTGPLGVVWNAQPLPKEFKVNGTPVGSIVFDGILDPIAVATPEALEASARSWHKLRHHPERFYAAPPAPPKGS